MFIESVTIDGFKSYSKRVEINGFDQSFNAITGLNGTGKSNILDAICFVLGVKNLDKVRAKSLQELVYKQGQAGVTKATVSITFNNEDPNRCPDNQWKDKKKITVTRQVQVGGKDKYLINGVNAQAGRVHDMFQAFKLNVNNPHFLVMQGRITKVLNMKPMEMLKMLEEAIGTQMYQEKRGRALKNMEKKEQNLADIEQLLESELKPQLVEMQQELEDYKAYQRAVSEVDTLEPLIRAYNYFTYLQQLETLHSRVEEAKEEDSQLDNDTEATQDNIKGAEEDAEAAQKKLQQMGSGKLKTVEMRVQDLGLKLASLKGDQDTLSDSVKVKRQEKQDYQTSLDELSEEVFAAAIAELQQAADKSAEAAAEADAEFEAAKCHLAGAERGDGRDVNNLTMPERVKQAEDDMKKHRKEAERLQAAVKHLTKEFNKVSTDAEAKRGSDAKLLGELDKRKAALAEAEAAVAASGFDGAALARLKQLHAAKSAEVQKCQRNHQSIMGNMGNVLSFNYQDPSPNFNRRQVRGPIARLATPKDPAHTTALEVAAGGKLGHVAVDTDKVGADLLKRGRLQRRTTFVPLNVTKSRPIAPDRCAAAQRVTNGRAKPALDLVRYSADVKVAVEYAYGTAFICDDSDAAKTVCFERSIATRGISLQGDDFNPGGTLTGGSRRQGHSTLAKVAEIEECEAHLDKLLGELRELEQQLGIAQQQHAQHEEAVKKVEVAKYGLQCVEQEAASSAGHKAQQQADELEAQLKEQQERHAAALEKANAAEEKAKDLKKTMALMKNDKGAVVKDAQAKLKAAKKAQEAAHKIHSEHDQVLQGKLAEQENAETQRGELQEQLEEANTEEKKAAVELDKVLADYKKLEEGLKAAETEKETLERDRAGCGKEIKGLEKQKAEYENLLKTIVKQKSLVKKQKEKLEKEVERCEQDIKTMEKDFPSLVDLTDELGVVGGRYDFQAQDIRKKQAAYQKAQQAKNEKECSVNKQVMTRAEQLEKEYDELTEKQATVIKDRDALKQVISELDGIRKQTLESTWMKVTGMFSDIFKTLLPGTEACLQPSGGPNGDFLEGLEVRVAFGEVWKESLSELSGGQRSLLSLSLILALLKLQPAPVYILDEVDAALDPAHTQNIGKLIKEQFSQAQFLIVSLKDGMFSNANVLFRTQFVDGSSTVRATRNGGSTAGGSKRGPAKQPAKKAGRKAGDDQENYMAT